MAQNMKTSIILICPYFGNINKSMHSLWLKSCAGNPDIEFLFITDNMEALQNLPENVRGVFMTWEDCRDLVCNSFEFETSLETPYKLCDYRPAYGVIFSEYIKQFAFWGHTDSGDTIYGDLRKYLTEDILSSYDKIHILGHLSLFRNNEQNNHRFAIPMKNGLTAEDVFSAQDNLCFDDMFQKASINGIFKDNQFPLLERIPDLVADILPYDWNFRLSGSENVPRIYEWEQGHLFEIKESGETLKKREIGYVHFQKRKMVNEVPDGSDHFYMVPNRFIEAEEPLTIDKVREWSRKRFYLGYVMGRCRSIWNYLKQPKVFVKKVKGRLFK